MLNVCSTVDARFGRREFLRIGSLAVRGVGLADVLRQRAAANESRHDKAVIQVFLCGGPSQHDTFDPKPDAPAECRGPYQPISTKLPGVRVTEFFPRLAGDSLSMASVEFIRGETTNGDRRPPPPSRSMRDQNLGCRKARME